MLSAVQFGAFDCNGVKALSFASGVLTVFVALFALDRVYILGIAPRPGEKRIVATAAYFVVGVAVAICLGWFTFITHMCG